MYRPYLRFFSIRVQSFQLCLNTQLPGGFLTHFQDLPSLAKITKLELYSLKLFSFLAKSITYHIIILMCPITILTFIWIQLTSCSHVHHQISIFGPTYI